LVLYHVVHVGGTAEGPDSAILDAPTLVVGPERVVQLRPVQRDRLSGRGGSIQGGLQNPGSIAGTKGIEVSKIGTVLFEGAVLPAAPEVYEADPFKTEELDIRGSASQLPAYDGPNLAELANERGLHWEGWHGESFAAFKASLKGGPCTYTACMVLNAAGLHVLEEGPVTIQDREPPGPEIADVAGWALGCEEITAAHARGQPAADAVGSAGEYGQMAPFCPEQGEIGHSEEHTTQQTGSGRRVQGRQARCWGRQPPLHGHAC
jgi:hypothetical protein